MGLLSEAGLQPSVLDFYLPDYPTGVTHSYTIGWYILSYHRASPYSTVVANGNARQYGNAAPYPYRVTYLDRLGPLYTRIAFLR